MVGFERDTKLRRKVIAREMARLISEHRQCRIADLNYCELFYELVDWIEGLADDIQAAERELMICGHPFACRRELGCIACKSEELLLLSIKKTVEEQNNEQRKL